MVDDYDVVEPLFTLADACVELLPADAAGLMLAHPAGGLRVVTASPQEPMTTLELFEIQTDQGLCGLLPHRGTDRQRLDCRGRTLSGALQSRVTIEQAKGILAERAHIKPTQAFQRLRAYSRSHSQPLNVTSQSVIDGTVDIGQRIS